MLCPKCQTQNPENAKFCVGCGVSLSQPISTQPQATAQLQAAVPPTIIPTLTPHPNRPLQPSNSWQKPWLRITFVVATTIAFLVVISIIYSGLEASGINWLTAFPPFAFLFFCLSQIINHKMLAYKPAKILAIVLWGLMGLVTFVAFLGLSGGSNVEEFGYFLGLVIGYLLAPLLLSYIVLWLWYKLQKKNKPKLWQVILLGIIIFLLFAFGRMMRNY